MTSVMFCRIFLLAVIVGVTKSQVDYNCPNDWYTNRGFCYKFEGDIPLSYDDARSKCNLHGAGVLSVANLAESSFIVQWLQRNDPFQRDWYTSGIKDKSFSTTNGTGFRWESTGERVEGALFPLWLVDPNMSLQNGVIIYTYGKSGYGWLFVDRTIKRPYICKIAEAEAYRILLTNRGFDYGIPNPNMGNLERGPHFLVQPKSVYVVSEINRNTAPVNLECIVQANPIATYKWFRGNNFEIEITKELDSRYTITNGKLTIDLPVEMKDHGFYRCEAENKFGKVISDFVEIAFGVLGEFNNVPDAGTRAKAYEGANVQCSTIQYRPSISYQWYKSPNLQFVRPQHQDYIFISQNGKLYFSEVTRVDEAEYSCVAILQGVNRFTIGTNQPPMRTSLPIPLIVEDQTPKQDWGPVIQNSFIAVFPKPPISGQDIRMECFAYGSSNSPFTYTWSRDDKPMPASAEVSDHNRVLIIRDARLEDNGIYRCTVQRGMSASDTKVVSLDMGASPYFVGPLHDQHADIDSQLTWICNAQGNPVPTYTWYKNGKMISTDQTNRVRVQKNVLTISQLDPDMHDGMYQCGATNTHGTALSTAQLRVLAFAPQFTKSPLPTSILASQSGNITLLCQPEGSPFPTIEWLKGSTLISSDGSKYIMFGNGNLLITSLTPADRGTYTCKATNSFGTAQISTNLNITAGATLTLRPSDTQVIVNQTAYLPCQASFPSGMDMIYQWTLNGYSLDYDEIFYRQVQDSSPGNNGLYIINAQFRHEGRYICTVRTPFNQVNDSAYLTVIGPPRQPAGIFVLQGSVTQYTAQVVWTAGSNSGATIALHVIEAADEYEPDVWTEFLKIPVSESLGQAEPLQDKHSAVVEGLNPGTGYRFRAIAQNQFGLGTPSDPSTYVRTLNAPPAVAPQHLRGGGGSVGELTMRWDPLKRSEYGSTSVGYRLYWRKKDDKAIDAKWGLEIVNSPTKDFAVRLVGAENYYLLYEGKIQAFNDLGFGPNSTVAEFYSAEALPIAVPENVNTNTFNSTAIEVMWDPVPDNRQYARGKIIGYQINYWNEEDDPDTYMQSIRYYGQLDYGLIIGCEPNVNMIVDVQVYNSAGLGPRSNQYIMELSMFAPLLYPQEVHIASAGRNRAYVWWRGIFYTFAEEGIDSYVIYLWPANEDYRGAEMIEIPGRPFSYMLHDIQDNVLYAIRIAAHNFGGYGRKSPTKYFTMEGQILIDRSLAETVEVYLSVAGGETIHLSLTLFYLCLIALHCLFHCSLSL